MTMTMTMEPTTNRRASHTICISGTRINGLQVEDFKFLTRLHYWAADTVTHGEKR